MPQSCHRNGARLVIAPKRAPMRSAILAGSCILAGALLATACSGPGTSSTLVPSNAASARHRHGKARVVLRIKVPRERHRHRRSHYVSPATASLAYTVNGGAAQTVTISASNPNCAVVGGASYLECTVDVSAPPGTDSFSFTTYDADGQTLSANTNVSYEVRTGSANQIPVVLGGVAAKLAILSPSGSQGSGFTIYGGAAAKFNIVPLDADDDYIIGPGAPVPVIEAAPSGTSMKTPSPSAPNTWQIRSEFVATTPGQTQSSEISAVATPVPDSGGSTVTANAAITLDQPWIYLINQGGNPALYPAGSGPVMAFDDQGNPKTLTGNGGQPFPLASPGGSYAQLTGIAYDPHNGLLYLVDSSNGLVEAFDLEGNPQTLTGNAGNPFPNLVSPRDVAYDSHNRWIYVADYNNGNPVIRAYDEQGNPQTPPGGFQNPVPPQGLTYDAHDGWLYLLSYFNNAVATYDESGNMQPLSGWENLTQPTRIGFDPHDDLLYITNAGGTLTGSVKVYDEQGDSETTTGSWFDICSPFGIAYHPNALLYVVNSSCKTVTAYDEQGNEQTLTGNSGSPFPGLKTPVQLVIVP
jgi:DNA-binding beta-propeller fold protein YncE